MTSVYSGMIPALASFIDALFSWQMLFGLLVGIFGGMVVGALPGLGPNATIPLLLPLTYVMDPIPAMAMLMSVYTCAMTGGSYTSILLKTPGTAGNIPTAFDGYPMARSGKALKACQISTYSSVFGGTFSAVCLLFVAPLLARVSLLFDSPEYFAMGLFGISLIASLASDSVLKGVVSGAFGFCLSQIGQFPLEEQYRYTFGTQMLKPGLSTTLIFLGLFAIAQVLNLTQKTLSKDKEKHAVEKVKLDMKSRETYTWAERLKDLPLHLYCSVVGLFVGILPGAGGNIGAFIGYNEAKRVSKHPESFGTGCTEGIVGPETANNATSGGAIIPMMTLGIPGSSTAALLMSALVIQGFTPGFTLFTTHANTTYPVLFSFLLINILMYFAGMLFVRFASRIVEIPDAILNVIVIVFVTIGGYSVVSIGSATELVMLLFGFGLIGYFFNMCKYSGGSLALGLVLGQLTEKGFRRSLVMARGQWVKYMLGRPIAIALILLTIITLFYPSIKKAIQRRKQAANS